MLHAGSAITAEEPSLPMPPATTAAARVQPAARPAQAGARQQQAQSRGDRTVIPSTVNRYEMARYESEEDLQLSSDGNDEEYVQSDGEDDYNDESDGQAPVSHSEVGVSRLVCTGKARRVHRLTGIRLLNLSFFYIYLVQSSPTWEFRRGMIFKFTACRRTDAFSG